MKGYGSTVVSKVGVVTDVDAIVELTGVWSFRGAICISEDFYLYACCIK